MLPITMVEIAISLLSALVGVTSVGSVFTSLRRQLQTTAQQDNKLAEQRSEFEQKVTDKPADPKAAWDLARVTLEQYFYRNLSQVTQIFYTAVGVMAIGFSLIVYGSYLALHQTTGGDLPSKLTVLSGVITEFVSVTFMVIYRSTLQQANSYMAVLEKINAVGMAVQIVESIPPTDPLYVETRATMAKMLLEQFKHRPDYQSTSRGNPTKKILGKR